MEKNILGLKFYYDSTDANKKGKRLVDFNLFDWVKYLIISYIKYKMIGNRYKQPEELNTLREKKNDN